MLDILTDCTPSDFGLDAAIFPEFRRDPNTGREVQLEAIEFAAYCQRRVAAASIPTGVGKSLIAWVVAKLTGMRTAILTGTKGLMDQYGRDFRAHGLVDIRGRSNYQCADLAHLDCRGGATMGCRYIRGGGCEYERAKHKAVNADVVSTNYSYWMTVNDKAMGLERTGESAEINGDNPVELLVLDEGDIAPDLLADYLSVRIYENEIRRWVEPKQMKDDRGDWQALAVMAMADITDQLKDERAKLSMMGHTATKQHVDRFHVLERLLDKFTRISTIADDWVIERRDGTRYGRMWAMDVVWAGRYAERYLFCNVPRVLIMSATLRPKTLALLGVSKDQFEFREWPRVFPANRHPIYSIPATNNGKEVRVDRRTSDAEMGMWVAHLDRIIDGRLDRKGLIQSVSYDRQKFLMDHSRHADLMLGNTADPESETAAEAAEEFRQSDAPKILVSPSFARGWDFPASQVEYIIICKVPFKPNQGKVMKAREQNDPSYGSYLAMQEMVQASGRGMRSETDRCEVFITDGHLSWFLYRNKSLAPQWFYDAVRKVRDIPKPPPRLEQ